MTDSLHAVRAVRRSALAWRLALGSLVGTGLSAVAFAAAAQGTGSDAPAAAPADEIETIVVTGSNIRRTDKETASPVQILSREDIERTGKQNIAEILRSVSADNQGSLPTSFSNGFASGSAGVSLRGLGLSSTLVLVNGRRMAPYGLADDGQRSFVDLNSIPLEAVERVEVLKDGASAIYGSDAVGGVVNIILRRNYQGASFGANFGTSYMDDGDIKRLNASYGIGDMAADGYNVFVTAEGSTQQAIKQNTRPGYLGTNDLTSYGWYDSRVGAAAAGFGMFYDEETGDVTGPAFNAQTPWGSIRPIDDPNQSHRINLTDCPEISGVTGMCVFDPIDYYEIQPQQDRFNLYTRGAFRIAEMLQAYAEAGYFYSKTEARGTPSGVRDSGVFDPSNPGTPVRHRIVLPAGHPDNPEEGDRQLYYMTRELGGRDGTSESDVIRVLAGLSGDVGMWNWDSGLGYIENKLTTEATGYVRFSKLQEALNNGTYRINNPAAVPQSLRDEISPKLVRDAKTSITFADAKVSGSLFDLPGGPFGVAFGAEWRKEKTDTPPSPYTDIADVIGLGYSAFKADRDVYAGYAEINAPVLKVLELNAAVRYDHYSDVGSSTTPKFGVKFKPIDQLALRGSYAEAFRAPGPAESGDSATFGYTGIGILTIGNPDIKPEKAKSYTLGLVVEPLSGLSASLDYYKIKRRDEIIAADQALVLDGIDPNGEPDSAIPGALPNSMVYYNELGRIGSISAPYVNANSTTTDGLDLDLRHRMKLDGIGTITASLTWTHVLNFERKVGDETREYAGTHGPYVLSAAAGTPQDRATFELGLDRSWWSTSLLVSYVGAMDMIDHKGEELYDIGDGTVTTSTGEGAYVADPNGPVCGVYNPDGTPRSGCSLSSFTTVDWFAKVEVGSNWILSGSVQNLFNRMAPFDPYTYGGLNYNPAFHQSGAVGRFFTFGVKYNF